MKRILVVEDNLKNLELITVILELDYEVVDAENGQLGVEAARTQHPDLILMDLSMPVLDGWEALKLIRADPDLKDIPVVACTAHTLDNRQVEAAGFDGYVSKPVDPSVLLDAVEGLLET